MLSNFRNKFYLHAIAAMILGLQISSALAANKFTGSIQTTNFRGDSVNQNHFTLKETVYLNGGPQNTNGPTVPPGTYYFQVTDPSGRTLLSTDNAVCRQVVVGSSGKIESVPGNSQCEHQLGSNEYPGDPRPNDRPVQLAPFSDTPNNGGGYKVWLIAKSSAEVAGCDTTIDTNNPQIIIFKSGCAKTDNFKVDFQSDPACAAWVDEFGQTSLDANRWSVVTGPAPGSNEDQQHTGTFEASHVSVSDGYLRLLLTQEARIGGGYLSKGGLIRTHVPCGYGIYEWTMRMGSTATNPSGSGINVSGGVSAGLTFWNNSETEIVFEHSAAASGPPENIWFVNFHNSDPSNGAHDPELAGEGTVTKDPLADVYETIHHYKFVWEPGKITFYVDGVEQAMHDTNVPSVPGFFMMSYFGRNFEFWGGFATIGAPRLFFIDRASYTPLE